MRSNKDSQDHLITLSFSGEKNLKEIKDFLEDDNIMNISIEKSDKENIKFTGQSVFKNENMKKIFLEKYSTLFKEYNLDREKTNNFF